MNTAANLARRILVVDDEARIREVVQYALQQAGFAVDCVGDGQAALAHVATSRPDLVVLDIGLPDIDGFEVCRRLRAGSETTPIPVLFLSARGEELDRVLGLELGGDDYLTKPFSPRELVARVRAVLRRTEAAPPGGAGSGTTTDTDTDRDTGTGAGAQALLGAGDTQLDLERHEARYRGTPIALTATEFSLLATLLRRPGVVFSRAQLMQQAYPHDNHVTERTLDTHVRRIRAKFRAHGGAPIATIHGVGYKADDSGAGDSGAGPA